MVGGYCIKQRANGPYYRPIYRCYNGSIDAKQCDGQSVYSAKKIEPAVIDIVHKYFASIRDSVEAVWKEQAQRQKRSTTMAQTKKKTAELEKLKEQKKALEKEIMKSLTGESVYEASLLNSMLTNCLAEIEQAENAIIELRRKKSLDDDRIQFSSWYGGYHSLLSCCFHLLSIHNFQIILFISYIIDYTCIFVNLKSNKKSFNF